MLLRHLRHLLEQLNILHWRNKQRHTGQTMAEFKGEGFGVFIDPEDNAYATLTTGLAQIDFNRVDYGDGITVLWHNSNVACTFNVTDPQAMDIARFLREHLSPGYSIE